MLGVAPGAGANEIHAAWRKRVSQWHPDRNHSPDATARLQEINDAYASIEHAAPQHTAWAAFPDTVLAGLSGTVFGQVHAPDAAAADYARANLDIPSLDWLLDTPVTLPIQLADGFTTVITLLHPGKFEDGSSLLFRRAGLSATGRVADLLVTVHIVAPRIGHAAAGRPHTQA